ncbi:unnamed protein product, partial [Didymodactylos carnosus]
NSPTSTTTVSTETTTYITELKWNSTGITVAGGNGAGNNTNQLNAPYAIFVDKNNYVYIADKGNNRIQRWSPGGTNGVIVAGNGVSSNSTLSLKAPPSLYVDSQGGIFVADESNNRVQYFSNGSLVDPDGTIYVTQTSYHRIINWITGTVAAGGNNNGSNMDQLTNPKRIFIDRNYSKMNYGWIDKTLLVQKWEQNALTGTTVAGGNGLGNSTAQLNGPLSVAVSSRGDVIVLDSGNNRIQKWSVQAATGQTIAPGDVTIGNLSNQLNSPRGIALDSDDNLYVADTNNNRVQKFSIIT